VKLVKEKKPAREDQSSMEDFLGSRPEREETEDPKSKVPDEEAPPFVEDPPARQKSTQGLPPADSDVESEEEKYAEAVEEPEAEVVEEPEAVSEVSVGDRDTPQNLPPSFLLSIDYAGQQKKAVARLYEPNTKQLFFWFDNRGHLPYCYTDLPPQAVKEISRISKSPGFVRTESVKMFDLLQDQPREMTKVIADDPLSIGGRTGSIREELVRGGVSHAWEANIRYRNCYTYDNQVVPGLIYKIEKGNLNASPPKIDSRLMEEFKKVVQDEGGLDEVVSEYAPMFFTEVPDIRRLAVDIEVFTPVKNRVPDAATARYEITAIGMSDNESYNKCFVLKRKDHPVGTRSQDFPATLDVVYFDSEVDMLAETFRVIDTYPIVLTFVGDAFDLNYMYHRAERLGIDVKRQCPITLGKDVALLKRGIHVDLYRFLKNPSIRLYALSGAYEQNKLDSIAKGLLGVGKRVISGDISSVPYLELAHYCWQDANITLRVTQYENNLLLRLIVLLMRISRLSMEDVTRQGISSWIQSLFRQEHRSRKYLIPRQADIESAKSSEAQTAPIIKDKRFKGAIVIEPVAGVHFNATVLDFASLYPTIMKYHNISYETVDCPHEECKNATDNRVPETDHWICKKRRGMISQTIGFFRDTRVKWFKARSKDKSLDEKTRNWYSVVEKALKVFVNASYGVTGAEHFELFCMPAAESVTAYGRDAIMRTKSKAESMGINVLYGDTDSLFMDNPTKEQQEQLIQWSRKELGIDLEVDKTYKYVALSGRKKNYIGVYKSGAVEVKGLTGKKRNTPDFAQEAFRHMLEVLSRVDTPDGFEAAKVQIREIVSQVIDRLEGRGEPYTPDEVAFRVQVTKPLEQYGKTKPQHVRAALILRGAGYDVPPGTIVAYIKTKGEDGVLPVELAQGTSYWLDKEKYVETLHSVFEQVLDSVGLEFEELMGFTTLDQFF
jgi:DNA polymerase I